MTLTPRENFIRYYKHEKGDRFPRLGLDAEFLLSVTGMRESSQDPKGGKDWFGAQWAYEPEGAVPDVSVPTILDDICNWREKVTFPDLDAIDWANCAKIDGVDKFDRENKIVYIMMPQGPFERLHTLMGFEESLCALLTDPEEVSAFFDEFMEFKCKMIDILAKYYKPDVICFHDDWGTQRNMFFSPDIWRELIKPQIQKAVDTCHNHGIFFEMHSCGKMDQIIPEFVDIKIDSFQCMGINDIPAAMKKTGNKLSYMVIQDYQKLEILANSSTLTEEQARILVGNQILKEAKKGIYMPDFFPMSSWWFPIAMDEIQKCEEVIFGK